MTYTYFDIETSGLRHDDVLLSFAYRKDSWDDGRYEAGTLGVDCVDERSLLGMVKDVAEGTIVMYNGETWKGGFDVPFLRTRMVVNGVKWPFKGCQVLDLYPVIQRYFNTMTMRPKKRGEGDVLSRDDRLDSVYRMLGGPAGVLRASDLSGADVPALYEKYLETAGADYMALIREHNVDDVKQLEYVHNIIDGFMPRRRYSTDMLKKV